MVGWSGGYVSDIEYTKKYFRELDVEHIRLASILNGYRPLEAGPLRYLELGAGFGLTSLAMAAANPESEFTITDFNPQHIANIASAVRRAGLSNVEVREEAFDETASRPSKPFDVISLHGVYSWISEPNRKAIVEIIRQQLKPGGNVYVSYNCNPGWSALQPLRELFVRLSDEGSSTNRLTNNLAQIKQIRDLGAKYFASTKAADDQLNKILGHNDKNYLVHEYMNDAFSVFWFADVAKDLENAKLSFVASANLMESVKDLNFTKEQMLLLDQCTELEKRETIQDIFLNRRFRKDVFVRGPERLSKYESGKHLSGVHLMLSPFQRELPEEISIPLGTLRFDKNLVKTMIETCLDVSIDVESILKRCGEQGFPKRNIFRTLIALMHLGFLVPARRDHKSKNRESVAGFNKVLIEDALIGRNSQILVSSKIAPAYPAGFLSQLFLGAEAADRDPILTAKQTFKKLGVSLASGGQSVPDDKVDDELHVRYEKYMAEVRPVFERLGIATDAPHERYFE